MELIAALVALFTFSFLSFWKGTSLKTSVLWPITAAISIITGFLFFDKYVDYVGITFGIVLFLYCLFCISQFYFALTRGREEEE